MRKFQAATTLKLTGPSLSRRHGGVDHRDTGSAVPNLYEVGLVLG